MKRIGVAELRGLNATKLHNLAEPLEICHKNQPLRVLIPYQLYIEIQDAYRTLNQLVEPQGETKS